MDNWDELAQTEIKGKAKFLKAFSDIIERVRKDTLKLKLGENERKDYFIIVEENRMNSYFIHIVPKQVYQLFKEMQSNNPNTILGFSVLAGRHKDKDVRVSCFGVKCNLLGKALFSKKSL